ncbi:lysis protein [Escherichia coli]
MDKMKTLFIAVVVCIIAGLTAALCHYQSQVNTLTDELTTTQGALKTASQTIQQVKERNRELSNLDRRYNDEIKAIRNDISDLRSGLADGSIRLRINAVPVQLSGDTGTASRIDGATCRLTASAEQSYLTLREQLKAKDAKIEGLQDYIRTQCKTVDFKF